MSARQIVIEIPLCEGEQATCAILRVPTDLQPEEARQLGRLLDAVVVYPPAPPIDIERLISQEST